MKIVNLSVHKNNAAQRKRKEFRANALKNLKTGINTKDIVGYAFISWDEKGRVSSCYDVSDNKPYTEYNIPEIAKLELTRRVIE